LFSTPIFAQGTAFTYQGRLQNNGSPASGTYNLTFTLFTNNTGGTAVAGPVTNSASLITNGLFTVTMDFGAGAWNGETNWLQIGVETNGGAGFSPLNPRQEVTPAPYAIFAEGANAAGLSGTIPTSSLSGIYGGALNLTNAGNSFTGNGTGLTNVNAAALGGLAAAGFWQLGGNTNVPTGSNVIGTLNNQFLDVRVSNVRVMRLRLFTDGLGLYTNAPNIIGGSSMNLTAPNVVGVAIAGGGGQTTNGLSYPNTVNADFGAIGGGLQNTASGFGATVTGGEQNTASGPTASVNGGWINTASGNEAAVGGGFANTASGALATVGGGAQNVASNTEATVSGGVGNLAGGIGSFVGGGGYDGNSYAGNAVLSAASTIGGGLGNTVNTGAIYTFIGGGNYNQIYGDFNNKGGSAIVGGGGNLVSSNAAYSFIGGGLANQIFGDGSDNGSSVIVGGYANKVLTNSVASFIGGGDQNVVSSNAAFSTISSGYGDTAEAIGSFIGGGGYDGSSQVGNFINGAAATIGGGLGNSISTSGTYAIIGGGIGNSATNEFATVGGGTSNTAGGENATVAGGFGNIASGNGATIGGGGTFGEGNTASGQFSTVGGGTQNNAALGYAVICGGQQNYAGGLAFVGGGSFNNASGLYAMIPGGDVNTASGQASFAAGYFADANQNNCFVWSDGEGSTNFPADRANQFKIQAGGGVYMAVSGSSHLSPAACEVNSSSSAGIGLWVTQSSSDSTTVFGNGGTGDIIKGFSGSNQGTLVFEVQNDGTVKSKGVVLTSDRNAKANFAELNPAEVLAKVAALPVTEWNYKDDPADKKHIGPVAQDFHTAFGLDGTDDKHISVVDEGGVALAAIQGLNQKLEAKSAKLEKENAELEQTVAELKQMVSELAQARAK